MSRKNGVLIDIDDELELLSNDLDTFWEGISCIGENAFSVLNASNFMSHNLKHLTILEGVKIIKNNNFKECTNLEEITLPNSLKYIGTRAFYGCSNLKEIVIPEGVEKIGEECFYGCENLEKVTLPKSLTYISNGAFSGCKSLKEISIPNGVYKIGNNAFSYCENLINIDLPLNLVTIGNDAFHGCVSLKEIIIPEGFEKITINTFFTCHNLEKITLPESLKYIEEDAFFRCLSLKNIEIPNGVEKIDSGAFYRCEKLEKVKLPQGLKYIEDHLFSGCISMKKISIPGSVAKIGNAAFACCEKLEEIELFEGLKEIDVDAFHQCEKLKEIKLPEGLKKIELSAFYRCWSLNEIIIPKSVENIKINSSIKIYGYNDICSYISILADGKLCFSRYDDIKNTVLCCPIYKIRSVFSSEILDDYLNQEQIKMIMVNAMKYYDINVKIPFDFFYSIEKVENLLNRNMKNMANLFKIKPRGISDSNIPELYKLASCMGILEDKNITIKIRGKEVPVCDVAFTVLQGAFKRKDLDFNELHMRFQSMKMGSYNEEFLKFMANKTNLRQLKREEEVSGGLTARIYEWFEERKYLDLTIENDDMTIPKDEENRYKVFTYDTIENGIDRIKWKSPTVELLKKEFAEKKFEGITNETRELAQYLSAFNVYTQKHFDKAVEIDKERREKGVKDHLTDTSIKEDLNISIDDYIKRTGELRSNIIDEAGNVVRNQTHVASKIFTYEMLAKGAKENFAMGLLTSCCATLYGAGAGAQRAMILHRDMQPLVIRNGDGNIVCFGIIYVNREEGYAVVNDFELNRKYEDRSQEIYTKAIQGVSAFVKQYNIENSYNPIKTVTCGLSPNWGALNNYIKQNSESEILKAPNFNDFKYVGSGSWSGDWHKEQFIIWEEKEEGKKYER